MARVIVLLAGLAVGVVLAGIGAGLLIPQVPVYRSPAIVRLSAVVLIGACVGLALFITRPRRR